MTLDEIKTAVRAGKTVIWKNEAYTVQEDKIGQWLIVCSNGHCWGLTWADGKTMNERPEDFRVVGVQHEVEECA